MRALVTGITGQDGWYLSDLLTGQGYRVFGLVTSAADGPVPPAVEPIVGDMRDGESLRAALATAAPDEVYNLASISSVAQSWREPEAVADVNGTGVVRLLAALREIAESGRTPPRLVQAGSAEIFGNAPAPQSERTPIAPLT